MQRPASAAQRQGHTPACPRPRQARAASAHILASGWRGVRDAPAADPRTSVCALFRGTFPLLPEGSLVEHWRANRRCLEGPAISAIKIQVGLVDSPVSVLRAAVFALRVPHLQRCAGTSTVLREQNLTSNCDNAPAPRTECHLPTLSAEEIERVRVQTPRRSVH